MKASHLIPLLLILSLTTSKVLLTNLHHNFKPQSQTQYLDYVKLMMGKHQQSTILSQNLKQVLKVQRPSLINTPQQFVLYIISSQSSDQGKMNDGGKRQNGKEMNEEVLARELKGMVDEIAIKIMKNGGQSVIEQIKKNHQNQDGKQMVHILEVGKNQMKHFEKIMPTLASSRRLQGQTPGANDSTYLIKFFFSILFVIVIIAIIGFISDGSSKKDTLLYAKFIADVGNR